MVKPNTMTIGWMQIGISQGKPVINVMVRESRYTKEFIDKSGEFTVNIPLDESYKEALSFCGVKSGRDFDKFKECNIKTFASDKVAPPSIANCLNYECKVLYKTVMTKELTAKELSEHFYKTNDYHTIYTGEILSIKEN